MKILVTGTAGFIGYHLANRLLAEGHEVIGLDSINNYYDVSLKIGRLEAAGIPRNQIAYKELLQSYFIDEDWIWKTLVYGNILDYYLIKRLKKNYVTVEPICRHPAAACRRICLSAGRFFQCGGVSRKRSVSAAERRVHQPRSAPVAPQSVDNVAAVHHQRVADDVSSILR